MKKLFLTAMVCAGVLPLLAAVPPEWNFLPGGNGGAWKMPAGAETKWTDKGLYLHGPTSAGIEMVFPDGLDAGAYPFFHFSLSAGEYASAYLYFARDGEDYSPERRVRLIHKGFHADLTGRVDCRSSKHWKGTIRKVRFNPIGRELDNALIRTLSFRDGAGGMVGNGSFEASEPGTGRPAQWRISGAARVVAGRSGRRALLLEKGAVAEQTVELIHEYPVELSFSCAGSGTVELVHLDIFDREISRIELPPGTGDAWTVRRRRHDPPAGTAYIRLKLKGAPGATRFDDVNLREIVPETEKYRWWDRSSWIWDAQANQSEGKPVCFRKSFNIADLAQVEAMVMQVGTRNLGAAAPCDRVAVYLNGTALKPAYDAAKGSMITVYDLKPLLKKGRNLLALSVVNLMSPGAVNVDILAVSPGNAPDKFQRFGSGPSWKSSPSAPSGWQLPGFDDAKWRNAMVRGQATPGSFCRLPYRFMGTAGKMRMNEVKFPEKISVGGEYRCSVDLALSAMEGFPGVTGGAALHFHLMDPKNGVTVKLRKFRITPEMIAAKKASAEFPVESRFLRSGEYELRIYGDRLRFDSAPAGFALHRAGNYLYRTIRVEGERRVPLADARIAGLERVPRIIVDGKAYPAMRFEHGAHTQFVTEESLDIAGRVHSPSNPLVDIQLGRSAWFCNADGTCDFSLYDTFIMSYLSRYPDARFIVHWAVDTAGTRGSMREWLLAHPSEWAKDFAGSTQSGTYQGTNVVASMASQPWQDAVADVTMKFVDHIRRSPYADRVVGLMPSCGISSEWMYWGSQARGFMDYSEPFQDGFRKFLREKYGTLAALNRAWGRKLASWDEAAIPGKPERMKRKYRNFLTAPEHQAITDMREFLNKTVSDAILKVLRAVKVGSSGKMLAGVYYGYSMYVSGPYFGPFSGHHALGRLLESPDLDFLFSPCRYDDRGPGGASGAMMPIASMRRHGKLYMDEADNRLVHSWNTSGKAWTLRESRSVIEREFAFALATGSGLGWLDFGEGWLPYDSRLCAVFENCMRLSKELTGENGIGQDRGNAVAVVLDEKAICRTAYDQNLFLNLVGIYPHLYRTGAAVHWYLLDDLESLEAYKCIIFTPTVTQFTPAQEKFIREKLENRGRTLVFLYSAGIYRGGKFDPANPGILPGLRLKRQEHFAKRALRRGQGDDPLFDALPEHYTFGFAEPTEFLLYADRQPGWEVLFTVDGSPLAGLLRRKYPDWTAIYSASPGLSAPVLRNLARSAGIRIFNPHQGDVTYAAKGFYAVHSLAGGKRTFYPDPAATKAVELLSGKTIEVKNGKFEFVLPEHSTVMFRIY